MTREKIVEKVNAVVAEEFEVELDVFTPVSYTHLGS